MQYIKLDTFTIIVCIVLGLLAKYVIGVPLP